MSRFTDEIEFNLKGIEAFSVGACPGCESCGLPEEPTEEEYDIANEPSFSSCWCDSCGSSFGGDRHAAHGIIDGEIHHFQVCTDCLLFHANGDEPEEPWYQHPREWRESLKA